MNGEAMPTGREKPGEHWNARIIREEAESGAGALAAIEESRRNGALKALAESGYSAADIQAPSFSAGGASIFPMGEPRDGRRGEAMMADFSLAAQTAAAHSAQWKNGWQYGTVWKFVNVGDEPGDLGPPAGDGWERNVDRADHGVEWVQPVWAKGDREGVRQYRTYWRRRKPGIVPGMSPDAHIHVQIP